MKVNLNSLYNDVFNRIKTDGKNINNGSITPRTTTEKVVLDKVSISPEAWKEYNKFMCQRSENNLNKLQSQVSHKQDEIGLLKQLSTKNSQYEDTLKKEEKNCISLVNKKCAVKASYDLIKIRLYDEEKEIQNFGFQTIYQEGIANCNDIKTGLPAVFRYGLDSESPDLKNIVGSYIEIGTLHPYERALFDNAFEYLSKTISAEEYLSNNDKVEYPNNVVLVDIFDRSTGSINEGDTQTHTVVLWKRKDDEIFLIDPSNINYSKHLSNNFNVIPLEPAKNIFYGSAGKETGYSDYLTNDPKPRDCVDIAVKIAFELNELQKISELDKLPQITDSLQKQLSNQKILAPHLILVKNDFVRTLQSSNKDTREIAFNTLNQALYMKKK